MRKSTPNDRFIANPETKQKCYLVDPRKKSMNLCDTEFTFDKKTIYKLSPDSVDLTPEQIEIFSEAFPDIANSWWIRW